MRFLYFSRKEALWLNRSAQKVLNSQYTFICLFKRASFCLVYPAAPLVYCVLTSFFFPIFISILKLISLCSLALFHLFLTSVAISAPTTFRIRKVDFHAGKTVCVCVLMFQCGLLNCSCTTGIPAVAPYYFGV